MRRVFLTLLFGLICLIAGLGLGICLGLQLKVGQPPPLIASAVKDVPWARSLFQPDKDAPYEMYDYPKIKWRAKLLRDAPGALAQLWTTYEGGDTEHQGGRMDYRLTVFKVPENRQFEVQVLDQGGFKIAQFNVSDFHPISGASDIMEARDSISCTEEQYKRMGDYSVK